MRTGAQLGRLGPRRSRIRRALAALLRRGVVRGRRYTSTQCCGRPARPRTAAPPASSCCNVQRRSRLRSSSSRAGRRTTPHACATRRRSGRCVLCVACCTLHVAWSGITSPHACATRATATAVVFLRFGDCSAAVRGWSGWSTAVVTVYSRCRDRPGDPLGPSQAALAVLTLDSGLTVAVDCAIAIEQRAYALAKVRRRLPPYR